MNFILQNTELPDEEITFEAEDHGQAYDMAVAKAGERHWGDWLLFAEHDGRRNFVASNVRKPTVAK